MRRFTRLTNGFSKKVENLAHAVSLHYMHHNFARPHKTLTKANNGYPTTPAMAVGVADHVWTLAEITDCLIRGPNRSAPTLTSGNRTPSRAHDGCSSSSRTRSPLVRDQPVGIAHVDGGVLILAFAIFSVITH